MWLLSGKDQAILDRDRGQTTRRLAARTKQVTLPGRTQPRVRSGSGCGDPIMRIAGQFANSGRSEAGQGGRPDRKGQKGKQWATHSI